MAATDGLFIRWTRVHQGKESQAMQLYADGLSYWSKQKEAGNIEGFEPVVLAAHGGDTGGFILVRGNRDKLSEIRHHDPEFYRLSMEWSSVLVGYGVIDATMGEGLQRLIEGTGELEA